MSEQEPIHPAQQRRLNLIKAQFKESEESRRLNIENHFDDSLSHSYKEKLEFLNQIKKIPGINEPVYDVGAYKTVNDKLPFKLRRDDVFDIALANYKVDEQISQSENVIEYLTKKEKDLDSRIQKQEKLNSDLLYMKENMNKPRINEDDNEEDSLDEKIALEKVRYRELKKLLRRLVEQYEPEEEADFER